MFTVLLLAAFMLLDSCRKNDIREGRLPNGYLVLSFDDTSIDNWYEWLPMLDSFDIKATFYISGYHTLTPLQKERLREIRHRGHEIAYHTTNHTDLLKQYNRSPMNAVIESEIRPDLTLMRNDGFYPENFAYPYGQHDPNLDREMLKYFKTVRGVCGMKNYTKCVLNDKGEKRVINALLIDSRAKVSDDFLRTLLTDINRNNDCALLYAHQIEKPGNRYAVPAERLRLLGRLARELNLRFVTTREIAP